MGKRMKLAIVGIDPKTKRCMIVATNEPPHWEDCRRQGLIAVPTTRPKAREVLGEVVEDIFELANA